MRLTNLAVVIGGAALLIASFSGIKNSVAVRPVATESEGDASIEPNNFAVTADVGNSDVRTKLYENGTVAERAAYVADKRDGLLERWFPDGTISYRAHYRSGRLHGSAQSWWEDGVLRSESNFEVGIAEGIQKRWYRSGAPFKELNLVDGRESGMQRAWRESGKLFANYEAREGRIFGLKRAELCYELKDENIQSQ